MIKHTDHGNKVFLDLVPASYLVGKDPDKIAHHVIANNQQLILNQSNLQSFWIHDLLFIKAFSTPK